MSSDSAKENASVVDSSVTGWKNTKWGTWMIQIICKTKTSNQTIKADFRAHFLSESPSCKSNNDRYPMWTQRVWHDKVGSLPIRKRAKLLNTRYFIIKSLNHHNLQLSVKKGIWATQVMNEPIMEEAFRNSSMVILIFSVNMSGFFQGYAKMMSSVGRRRDQIWSQGSGKSTPWGRSFKVKWLRLSDLPFQKTLHLKNPLNDYKPVKISRDCQELPEDIGKALCALIDGEDDIDGSIKSSSSFGDGEYSVPLMHMPWASSHMPYPAFVYQQQAEPGINSTGQGSAGSVFQDNSTPSSAAIQVASSKKTQINRDRKNLQINTEGPYRTDHWGFPAESPHASTLTDDDLHEMTYEEYLEVHSRSIKQLSFPGPGPSSLPSQGSSRSRKRDDDSDSSFVRDKSRSRKRTNHSPEN